MATPSHVVVRMYNVGFGDAFLLLFPGKERPRRVLVDCGMHNIGSGPRPMREVVQQIIADTTDPDGKSRIDVVVCTHRHQDHVSGFSQSLWDTVHVREVWMPWTEHPSDAVAKRIRDAQSSRAKTLALALTSLGADDTLLAMAQNSLTNAAAMSTLHGGFQGRPLRRFLPEKRRSARSFESTALPGVKIHVLGPSRSEEVIRDMNPERGESYLQFLLARQSPPGRRLRPFRSEWRISLTAYRRAHPHLNLTARQRMALANVGSSAEFDLVTKLEKAVNGTSLMLVFAIGRARLLFPGDAQWGTWKAALADPEWRDLLSATSFYKIGHHGSHNATPRSFVEKHLSKKFSAMVSTRKVRKWPDIPREPLLEALRERSDRVVRSDQRDRPDPRGFTRDSGVVETKVLI
jgi:beta-lactamase superfamily II metal-dependent hydrolase